MSRAATAEHVAAHGRQRRSTLPPVRKVTWGGVWRRRWSGRRAFLREPSTEMGACAPISASRVREINLNLPLTAAALRAHPHNAETRQQHGPGFGFRNRDWIGWIKNHAITHLEGVPHASQRIGASIDESAIDT